MHPGQWPGIVPVMRVAILIAVLLTGAVCRAPGLPTPASVAVLYNTSDADSLALAEFYRTARGIPAENLIGLPMPTVATISREDYESTIARPLRNEFERRKWWVRAKQRGSGLIMPLAGRMQVLVVMRGVPFRIKAEPKQPAPPADGNPYAGQNQAAVDSELAMFGLEGGQIDGPISNKYFRSEKNFADSRMPFMILTSRIDAPSRATCERMIRDAIDTEAGGLWGMAYVDMANKFPQGDQWLEEIVKMNQEAGIPVVTDRFSKTLPTCYPMGNAALYFGWYARNADGPFLNPRFRFRKGAVAVHIHSFSAEQLHDPGRNWSAALLERGAAATVGNVYEPFLHLTHDLGVLQQRLLAGHSWVEACWMAMPVVSWQGIVLGDPLYQPFRHLAGTGEVRENDRVFRALRAAKLRWPGSHDERLDQLEKAAIRLKSGELTEAIGLELLALGRTAAAAEQFQKAQGLYLKAEDKMRQDFHLIGIDRAGGGKESTLRRLHEARARYTEMPETKAISEWIEILDPPEKTPAAKDAEGRKSGKSAP